MTLTPTPTGGVAVVIPAYNEARTIRRIAEGACAVSGRVIVVNDGSTDDTAAVLDGLDITRLDLPENLGKAGALLAGFREALKDGDVQGIVTVDGDGQHRVEDLPLIVAEGLRHGDAIVAGSRLWDAQHFPRSRLCANRVANFWISWAAGQRIADSQCGLRYYPASVLRRIDLARCACRGFVLESELLIVASWAGARVQSVKIPALYDERALRPSHFRPVTDIALIVIMVAGKLFSRGMNIPGLLRSLGVRRPAEDGPET